MKFVLFIFWWDSQAFCGLWIREPLLNSSKFNIRFGTLSPLCFSFFLLSIGEFWCATWTILIPLVYSHLDTYSIFLHQLVWLCCNSPYYCHSCIFFMTSLNLILYKSMFIDFYTCGMETNNDQQPLKERNNNMFIWDRDLKSFISILIPLDLILMSM